MALISLMVLCMAMTMTEPGVVAELITAEIDPCSGAVMRVSFTNPGPAPITLRSNSFELHSLGNPRATTVRVDLPSGEQIVVDPVVPMFESIEDTKSNAIELAAGETWATEVLVSTRPTAAGSAFVFAEPGVYVITVQWHGEERVVESNAAQLTVRTLEEPAALAAVEAARRLASPAVLFDYKAITTADDLPILEGIAGSFGTEHTTWARLTLATYHADGAVSSIVSVAERERRVARARDLIQALQPMRNAVRWQSRVSAVEGRILMAEAQVEYEKTK